jgi:hypothetical protein
MCEKLPGMRIVLGICAGVASLALAAPARADVLVNAPSRSVRCGGSIKLGVWYRDFPTTGHRGATVDVLSPRGFVVFHRTVVAPSQWKYWHYTPGVCGKDYTVRYRLFTGTEKFSVHVQNQA